MPRKVLGIPIRNILFNRAIGLTIPPYYTDPTSPRGRGKAEGVTAAITRPLKRAMWWGMEHVSKNTFSLKGERKPMHSLPGDLFISGQVREGVWGGVWEG